MNLPVHPDYAIDHLLCVGMIVVDQPAAADEHGIIQCSIQHTQCHESCIEQLNQYMLLNLYTVPAQHSLQPPLETNIGHRIW